jgi:hypothetical protein
MAEVADSMKSDIDTKPALMPVFQGLTTPLRHLCEKHCGIIADVSVALGAAAFKWQPSDSEYA